MKLVILLFIFNALFLSHCLLKKSQSKKAAALTNIAENKLNLIKICFYFKRNYFA